MRTDIFSTRAGAGHKYTERCVLPFLKARPTFFRLLRLVVLLPDENRTVEPLGRHQTESQIEPGRISDRYALFEASSEISLHHRIDLFLRATVHVGISLDVRQIEPVVFQQPDEPVALVGQPRSLP